MTKGYQELVGLQVTFDKAVARYHLIHYYRTERVEIPPPALVMRGYDMDRHADIAVIQENLIQAYEPAILTIWRYETVLSASEYLQFHVRARPDELGIEGDWKILP